MLLFVFLIPAVISASAADELSWYFKKNDEHKQPLLDEAQSFINGYSCYYADKKHGDDNPDKVIYLTFDAGYENGCTAQILDILKKHQAPAAFFLVGNYIQRNPSRFAYGQRRASCVQPHDVA